MVAKINDVAKLAKVSIATVSRVINNVPIVNGATRARVEEAIKELNYKPNATARKLKLQKSNTIGIVIDDVTRTFLTRCLHGIEHQCEEYGYNIILFNTYPGTNQEDKTIDHILQNQCDGLIFIGTTLTDNMRSMLEEVSFPVVIGFLDEEFFTSVSMDMKQAAKDAVSHFAKHGHKRIGMLNSPKVEQAATARLDGFLEEIRLEGLTTKPQWILNCENSVQGGYKAMYLMIESGDYPSAIFCVNDDLALGAIRAAEKNGLKVPEDLSVIGMGDSFYCEYNKPALTSIGLDHIHFGNELAKALFSELESGQHQPASSITVSHDLIERDSVIDIIE